MICKNCDNEFDKNMHGTVCPKCGMDDNCLQFSDAGRATKYLIEGYGKNLLADGEKFIGLIYDTIPDLTKEKNWFFHMYSEGIFTILYIADDKPVRERKKCAESAVRKLIGNVGLSKESAYTAVGFITYGMGWDLKKNDKYHSKNDKKVEETVGKIKKVRSTIISLLIVLTLSSLVLLFIDFNRKDGTNREINYSATKGSEEGTYQNAFDGKKGKVLIGEETKKISTKNDVTGFDCGVEFRIVNAEETESSFRYVYEVYNPTDNPVKFSNSESIVYNKNNEIIGREDFLYSIQGEFEGEIIYPKSSILFECSSRNCYSLGKFDDFDRIETEIEVYDVDIDAARDVYIYDVMIVKESVTYKIKANKDLKEFVDWQISFFDKEGNIIAYSEGGASLNANAVEKMTDKVIRSGKNNPIEHIVFNASTE